MTHCADDKYDYHKTRPPAGPHHRIRRLYKCVSCNTREDTALHSVPMHVYTATLIKLSIKLLYVLDFCRSRHRGVITINELMGKRFERESDGALLKQLKCGSIYEHFTTQTCLYYIYIFKFITDS